MTMVSGLARIPLIGIKYRGEDVANLEENRVPCPSCGRLNLGYANYCSGCGSALMGIAITGAMGAPMFDVTEIYVPVRLAIEYEEPLSAGQLITNRLLLFVKWLFAIPLYIIGAFYAIAAFIVTFIAFWAILFTGRFPEGLFSFVRGYFQYIYHVFSYFPFLLTNHFMPDERSPIRLEIDYPTEPLSRLVLVFVKLPSFLLEVVSGLAAIGLLFLFLISIPSWFIILITGRYPRSWFALSAAMLEWNCRVSVWQNLMRDDFSLFGTTTTVKILVGIGLVAILILGIGNCSVNF